MADDKEKKKKVRVYKKGRDCPRCGAGTKLAKHKDRYSCGKCGYYEKITAEKEEKGKDK